MSGVSGMTPLRGKIVDHLLSRRDVDGAWTGRLSDSALATAVVVIALDEYGLARAHGPHAVAQKPDDASSAASAKERGVMWLRQNRNPDGGWGDTPSSPSNLAATLLGRCALGDDPSSEQWICARCGGRSPEAIRAALRGVYGEDLTFAAPILATCALRGLLGAGGWAYVPQLPLELGLVPHRCFRWLCLPVVSYALPALVAIGCLRHHHAPRRGLAYLRKIAGVLAFSRVKKMQPTSGGFLEAAPLTAFVTLSLCATGRPTHPVCVAARGFLLREQRENGSWAIDANLSSWLTFHAAQQVGDALADDERKGLLREILSRQTQAEHPFTGAAAGGWGWTNRDGVVPDADDTAAALLALHRFCPEAGNDPESLRTATLQAAQYGVMWLLRLQNADGGMPTFCRGRGRLPFDASCPDLTAHALSAWRVWRDVLPEALLPRVAVAQAKAAAYLRRTQKEDGSWVPLWFGNQHLWKQENPLIGTAFVLRRLGHDDKCLGGELRLRAVQFLLSRQRWDGGWGENGTDGPTIEETALAVAALCAAAKGLVSEKFLEGGLPDSEYDAAAAVKRLASVTGAIEKGMDSLRRQTREGTQFPSAAVGLYFASLWYDEQLYPLLFAADACGEYEAWRKTVPGNPVVGA